MNVTNHISRRSFIKTTTGLAVSAGLLSLENPLFAAGKKKWVVGCRELHLKQTGQPDSWSAMKAVGAEGVEVYADGNLDCPYLFHPQRKYSVATADGIKALKDEFDASGCRITAFMMANAFDAQLEKELECARALVKAAQQLGVNTLRIDVVPHKMAADKEAFLPFAIQACKRMCEIAEGTPIRYGVENHGSTTNDPDFLQRLFDGVGSSKLGLTLDCGNFYWWGHPLKDLYAIYEKFAPRAVHTHCKSIRYPEDQKNCKRQMGWEYGKYTCPIYEGDIDYKRVVKILRKANYQGDLCVEDESLEKAPKAERGEVLKKEVALLKKLA